MLDFSVIDDRTGKEVRVRYTTEFLRDLKNLDSTPCAHPTKEIRRRTIKGGAIAYVMQCLECGATTGNAISKSAIPDIENVKDVDPDMPNQWQAKRQARRHAIEQKHLLIQEKHGTEWWQRYTEYLKTSEWQTRRKLVMERANGLCEGCRSRPAVQVHHLTYEHVCEEFLWELVAICEPCHKRAHADEDEAKTEDPYAEDKARIEADNNEPFGPEDLEDPEEPEPYEPNHPDWIDWKNL
jgi:5-methylcytosine-specific restriction endonuclease McrA